MSIATVYKYVSGSYNAVTDEQYTDVGAGAFQLGTVKRAYLETGFQIRTAAGGGGTLLTLNVDYEFYQKDAYYTSAELQNVWTKVKVLNVTYQSGDLFISYRALGSYTDFTPLDSLETRVASLETDPTFFKNALAGLTLSNAADTEHDITIAAGKCRNSTDAYNMILSSAITKRIDASWAVGTDAGGLDTGTVANSTWYYIWLIRKDSDGSIDALFSTSVTAPTMPVGYTYKRRIGAVLTDSSANIIKFRMQEQNKFIWDIPSISQSTNPGTSRVLTTAACPPNFVAMIFFSWYASPGALRYVLLTSPSDTDTAPSGSIFSAQTYDGTITTFPEARKNIKTDSSSRFGYRISFSDVNNTVYWATEGFIDEGRLDGSY